MTAWDVPLTDVALTEADIDAFLDCLRDGWVTMGPRTQQFETEFAARFGARHAVAVSSGTAALHLALQAAGLKTGDEVLVPAMTFVAGPNAVRYCGATPVLIESRGANDLNIDPDDAARHVGPRTRAVLATHWMGYACDLHALEQLCDRHGLLMIEDCAQSITATGADGRVTGAVGKAGCFSFFSKKQLSVGEGGMVITDDPQLAAKVRSLRSHAMTTVTWDRDRGYAESYDVVDFGFNFRIDEGRAALGLSRLPRLQDDVARRRELVGLYRDRLSGLSGVTVPWSEEDVKRSSHFGFPIVLETPALREHVRSELAAHRIQTTWYPAISNLSAYREHPPRPRTEDLAARHLLLPLSSTFSGSEVEHVARRLTEIVHADALAGT